MKNLSVFADEFQLHDACPIPWQYQSAKYLQALSYHGFILTYDGGGFVADLGYNEETASGVIDKLEANNWLDDRTVIVFVEFTIFEPSSMLFSSVKHVYEHFQTSGSFTGTKISTLTVYSAKNKQFESFYQVCRLLLIIIIIFLIAIEIGKIYRKGFKQYFKEFWNWMELVQINATVTSIVLFFLKEKYASLFVKGVRENPFETSSTDNLVFWSEAEIYLLSVVVFVMTIKLLRFMRFNQHIGKVVNTIRKSAKGLASFFVVFFCILMAFTQLGYLLFGSVLLPYSSFFNTMRSVLQMLLGGDMYFFELNDANRVLGPLFVFCFVLSMTMVMLNMFLAIINEAFMELDCDIASIESETNDDSLGEFTKTYFVTNIRNLKEDFLGCFKRRFRRKGPLKDSTKTPSVESITSIEECNEKRNLVPLACSESNSISLDDIKSSLIDIRAELHKSISSLTSKRPLSIFDAQPVCAETFKPYQPYSLSLRYEDELRKAHSPRKNNDYLKRTKQKTANVVKSVLFPDQKETAHVKYELVKCSCEEPEMTKARVLSSDSTTQAALLVENVWAEETNV